MSIKTFLAILAFLGIVHGVAFLIAPDQVATSYGLPPSAPVALMARFFGGALIAWCGMLWMARNFRDEGAVRAVLTCTAIADAIGFLTAIAATVAGTFNGTGWIAVAIYAFGTCGSVYFLMGNRQLVMAS
jgi:hypothetical protein